MKANLNELGKNGAVMSEVDQLLIEVNGGDQEYKIYERDGELIIKKIESGQPNKKATERMLIKPYFSDQIGII